MTTIEKIRAQFVEHLRSARALRDEFNSRDRSWAYRYEIQAEAWQIALNILDKHTSEEQPKESSGPMPWRLQIAAMLIAAAEKEVRPSCETFIVDGAERRELIEGQYCDEYLGDAFRLADALIAEHERTK